MDRRTSLQWMLAAAGAMHAVGAVAKPGAHGVGTDPDLLKRHRSGDLWALSFSAAERRCARALCTLVIPADWESPSAGDLHVEAFIDEWISAPYPDHVKDRALVRQGLAWLDQHSTKTFGKPFADASDEQRDRIADAICKEPPEDPALAEPVRFFARFRDLAAGGFYTTPEGMKDLGFVGNVPSQTFDGPPLAVLKLVGVT